MKILLAVDGSVYTQRMLDHIVGPGRWPGTLNQFAVIHCAAAAPHRSAAFEDLAVVQGYYDEDAQAVLRPVREFLARHDIVAACVHDVGSPARKIADLAQREGFDLIVMGSHGLGALANVVLGSVATQVLALCQTPVLLIR